jgi:hypothetical protein
MCVNGKIISFKLFQDRGVGMKENGGEDEFKYDVFFVLSEYL